MDIIRSAHSAWMMLGALRYNRSNVSAAFFLTKGFEVLGLVSLPACDWSEEKLLTEQLAVDGHLSLMLRPFRDLRHLLWHEGPDS